MHTHFKKQFFIPEKEEKTKPQKSIQAAGNHQLEKRKMSSEAETDKRYQFKLKAASPLKNKVWKEKKDYK